MYNLQFVFQEQENGISETKSAFWKSTPGSKILTSQPQKSESQEKVHQKPLTNSTRVGEENGDNGVDALAANKELSRLRETENRLVNEIQELREQNELLEFRLLELEYYNTNSTNRVSTYSLISLIRNNSFFPQLTSLCGNMFFPRANNDRNYVH